MEGKLRPWIDCGSAVQRESGDEGRIKTKQSSGVIPYSDELGMQNTECFKISVVPRSEHCDLHFLRVSAMPWGG